jgi:hypothetical protein
VVRFGIGDGLGRDGVLGAESSLEHCKRRLPRRALMLAKRGPSKSNSLRQTTSNVYPPAARGLAALHIDRKQPADGKKPADRKKMWKGIQIWMPYVSQYPR